MNKLIIVVVYFFISIQAIGQIITKPTIREIKRGEGEAEFEYKSAGKSYIISFKDLPNTSQDSLNVYLVKNTPIAVFKSTIEVLDTLELEPVEKSNLRYVLIKTAGNRLKIYRLFFGKTIRLVKIV